MKKHQVEIKGTYLCPLNQQEIANDIHCGKLKVNQMIKELIEDGYVEMVRVKGRYLFIEKGQELLKKMSLDS